MNKTIKIDTKLFRWRRTFPSNVWIVIAAVVMVGVRSLWLEIQRPSHLAEITNAFGSVRVLQNPPQFSHDFSRFTCVTITDTRGVGVFLCDTATGKKRLVDIQADGPGLWQDDFDLQVWPWSSDDSQFIYAMSGTLAVCPVDTNQSVFKIPLGTNNASEAVWLNPSEFAWLEGNVLGHAQKSSDGQWTVERKPLPGKAKALTAVDTHTVAWIQDSYLCRFDFSQSSTGDSPTPMTATGEAIPLTNGMVLWLDASTLRLEDGAPVTMLADLSPNRNMAIKNLNPPKFNAPGNASALNGKGTIRFSSSNALTATTGLVTTKNSGINGNMPRSVFAVMRRDVGRLMIVGLGNAGGGTYFGVCDQFDGYYLPATMATDNKVPVAARNWNILSVVCDGSSQSGYVNGSLKGTTQSELSTADAPVELGRRTPRGGAAWRAAASDGDFAELLVYDRALDRVEQKQVENYLSAKWFGTKHISAQNPLVWQDTGLDEISGFLYAKDTGRFLIGTTNAAGGRLWLFSPGMKPVQILQDPLLGAMQWTGPGEFIYAGSDQERSKLFSADLTGKPPVPLADFGDIHWFTVGPNREKLFVWGVAGDDPAPGLWEYDTAAKKTTAVLPYAQYPSMFAKAVRCTTNNIRINSSQTIACTVFKPPGFDKGKKYPLVLGDTYVPDPIHGQYLQEGMAAAGAVVVFVNRPNWNAYIEDWEKNVRAVYEVMKQDPWIDTHRVYLIGASAETYYMNPCLEKTPGLWKGAILLNPGMLPDFSKSPQFQSRLKVLIDVGGEEHEGDRLKKLQQDSLQSGVVVEYVIAPTETHRLVGAAGKLARLQAINHFIFEE